MESKARIYLPDVASQPHVVNLKNRTIFYLITITLFLILLYFHATNIIAYNDSIASIEILEKPDVITSSMEVVTTPFPLNGFLLLSTALSGISLSVIFIKIVNVYEPFVMAVCLSLSVMILAAITVFSIDDHSEVLSKIYNVESSGSYLQIPGDALKVTVTEVANSEDTITHTYELAPEDFEIYEKYMNDKALDEK